MTVAFHNEFKSVKKVKNAGDFVYNLDQNAVNGEYIALPIQGTGKRVTFQRAMKFPIVIGQIFGLNPVLGIYEDDVSKLRFTFYSVRCMYSVLSVIGQLVLVGFCFLKIFWETDASLNSNTAVVFYACNCVITFQFLKVARKWPGLCRHIAKIEAIDPTVDQTLVWKCNATVAVVIVLAILEHSLSDLSVISSAMACQPDKHPYDAYLNQNFYWIWVYVPYSTFFGLVSKFLSIQCTFTWNYSDAFIMCLCWYVTARLEQVNRRLQSVAGQIVPQSFYRTMREDYSKATNLVRKVNDIVSGIIFVSFASNLFSICFLILHTLEVGLKPDKICNVPSNERFLGGYEHAAFFIYTISFLILRSLSMSLMAARVNSTSDEAAHALYDVPADSYNIEVQRFLDQIHGDSVVLSGLQFFSVKRGMVLTIAATIVTYELVLIQFTGVSTTKADKK
ncbi:trehalose receptor domain-containing protein [Phthorimaea operculella]|nr:trehalose receptor domain-containing protein [Phthorimaea operculella]